MGIEHWNLPLMPPSPQGRGGSGRASSSTQATSRKQLGPYPARGPPSEGKRGRKTKVLAPPRWVLWLGISAYLQCVLDGVGEMPQGAEGEGAIPGAGWLRRLGEGWYHGQHVPPCPLCA